MNTISGLGCFIGDYQLTVDDGVVDGETDGPFEGDIDGPWVYYGYGL